MPRPLGKTAAGASHRQLAVPEDDMCQHQPQCPDALAPDRMAARMVADQPGQGWSLLCNGVIVFDDGGELLADGRAVTPGRLGPAGRVAMAA